jgi:hypothetical protein
MERHPIPDHPNYSASADGRIWSVARGSLRELRQGVATVGRYRRAQVTLGRGNHRKVATLICLTFHGPRPEGHEAAHLNGNSLDNRASNLAWKTRVENELDKIEHGRSNRGSRQWKAKLTDQDVQEIRRLAAGGTRQAEIAARFKISQPTVSEIASRKKWAWLT